jgi:hypothetical protein
VDTLLKEGTDPPLAKSNLFCDPCALALNDLTEVTSHIQSETHLRNLKRVAQEKVVNIQTAAQAATDPVPKSEGPTLPSETAPDSKLSSSSEPQVVPVGVSSIVRCIQEKQRINFQTLRDLKSFAINTEEEAEVVKELTRHLVDSLHKYKTDHLTGEAKEALQKQGLLENP